MNIYKKLGVSKKTAKPGDLMMANQMMMKRKKMKKRGKTVKVTYQPGNYKEGEEIKAINALHEMHRGVKGKKKSKKYKKSRKNWISGAIKNPGALHRQLGIKQGQKIPASKLRAAASKGGTLGRRARLAQTLKGFNK